MDVTNVVDTGAIYQPFFFFLTAQTLVGLTFLCRCYYTVVTLQKRYKF